jgi:hypothetical protein
MPSRPSHGPIQAIHISLLILLKSIVSSTYTQVQTQFQVMQILSFIQIIIEGETALTR